MMPIGLCVAEVLASAPSRPSSLLVLINNCRSIWYVILNVFQGKVQLQIILLSRLLVSIRWRQRVTLRCLRIVQRPESLMHGLRGMQGLQA
jgi:hypothetical protein